MSEQCCNKCDPVCSVKSLHRMYLRKYCVQVTMQRAHKPIELVQENIEFLAVVKFIVFYRRFRRTCRKN